MIWVYIFEHVNFLPCKNAARSPSLYPLWQFSPNTFHEFVIRSLSQHNLSSWKLEFNVTGWSLKTSMKIYNLKPALCSSFLLTFCLAKIPQGVQVYIPTSNFHRRLSMNSSSGKWQFRVTSWSLSQHNLSSGKLQFKALARFCVALGPLNPSVHRAHYF